MNNDLIIAVEGGVITSISSDNSKLIGLGVTIIDYDVDESFEDYFKTINNRLDNSKTQAYVANTEVEECLVEIDHELNTETKT